MMNIDKLSAKTIIFNDTYWWGKRLNSSTYWLETPSITSRSNCQSCDCQGFLVDWNPAAVLFSHCPYLEQLRYSWWVSDLTNIGNSRTSNQRLWDCPVDFWNHFCTSGFDCQICFVVRFFIPASVAFFRMSGGNSSLLECLQQAAPHSWSSWSSTSEQFPDPVVWFNMVRLCHERRLDSWS